MHPLHHKAKHSHSAKMQSVAGTTKNHEAPDDKANRLAMQPDASMPPQPDPDMDQDDTMMGG